MSDRTTPETDDIARGNHVVPTEWAQQLERERDEARRQYCRGFTDFCPNPAHDHLSLEDAAVEVAKSFGWDCFKENSNA